MANISGNWKSISIFFFFFWGKLLVRIASFNFERQKDRGSKIA